MCFSVRAYEKDVLAKQKKYLDPLIVWARSELGVNLQITTGLSAEAAVPTDTVKQMLALVKDLDMFTLVALHRAVVATRVCSGRRFDSSFLRLCSHSLLVSHSSRDD